jgi:hypothetical protein
VHRPLLSSHGRWLIWLSFTTSSSGKSLYRYAQSNFAERRGEERFVVLVPRKHIG